MSADIFLVCCLPNVEYRELFIVFFCVGFLRTVRYTQAGGEEICKLIWRKNKLLPLKRSAKCACKMCGGLYEGLWVACPLTSLDFSNEADCPDQKVMYIKRKELSKFGCYYNNILHFHYFAVHFGIGFVIFIYVCDRKAITT